MIEENNQEHRSVSHTGPILGILIIVLVLILGGLYLWGAEVQEQEEVVTPRQIENNEPETVRATADAEILDVVSPSNELQAIEADLESTDLDSLDKELNEIDNEIDAALTNS